MQRLKLISVEPKIAKKPKKTTEQIICRRCNSSHFIKTVMAPTIKNNKISGGTDSLICVYCLANGFVNKEV